MDIKISAALGNLSSGSFYERFTEYLLVWYSENHRSFPWRNCDDPYLTWISEIMLQQTRTGAVIPYFNRFAEELPDVRHLAECPSERLMKLWEGLGYYSRARNLQKAAVKIMEDYEGKLPDSYDELLALPGIGPYTAGAIASIAFGRAVPAIDGNALRIAARGLGSHEPLNEKSLKKAAYTFFQEMIPEDRPGDFNQAVMDLGAMVCLPGKEQPDCASCPVKIFCSAFQMHETEILPVKALKKERRQVPLTVLIIQDGAFTAIRRRPEKGLLAGMYEFPNIEGYKDPEDALRYVRNEGLEPLQIERLPDSSHIFTHLEWKMIAYRIRVAALEEHTGLTGLCFISREDSQNDYAIPSAFRAYIRYLKEECT